MLVQSVCHYCGQPVIGRVIEALGASWHPEHFLCAGCGQPIRESSFQVVEGRPYHAACYLRYQAPRCAHCGQPVAGSSVEYKGRSYHPECYSQYIAPRCAHCGQPISGAYTTYKGQTYHTACFQNYVAPRCVYCHKALLGDYLIDGWGNTYCAEHEKEYPHCSFCGRLISPLQQTPGWNDYASLRCPVCRSTAIESADQARPLFQECKQWISRQGFQFHQLPLRLELRDHAWLVALWPDRSITHPRGVTLSTTRSQNGQVIGSHIDGVAVLQGMPAVLFCGVVLHELGHVWLTVQQINDLPAWAEEGFCQMLSWRYYKEHDTPEARYYATNIERDDDPIYGDGFRRISTYVQRIGFERLTERLLHTRRLPPLP